jgi:hypothetical protein
MELLHNPRMHEIFISHRDEETRFDVMKNIQDDIDHEINELIGDIHSVNTLQKFTIDDICEIEYDIDLASKKIFFQNDRGSIMELSIFEGSECPINNEARLNILYYKILPNSSSIWTVEWTYIIR